MIGRKRTLPGQWQESTTLGWDIALLRWEKTLPVGNRTSPVGCYLDPSPVLLWAGIPPYSSDGKGPYRARKRNYWASPFQTSMVLSQHSRHMVLGKYPTGQISEPTGYGWKGTFTGEKGSCNARKEHIL